MEYLNNVEPININTANVKTEVDSSPSDYSISSSEEDERFTINAPLYFDKSIFDPSPQNKCSRTTTTIVPLELRQKYKLRDMSIVIDRLPKSVLEILHKKEEISQLLRSVRKRQLPKKRIRNFIDIKNKDSGSIKKDEHPSNSLVCPYKQCGFKGKFTTELEVSMHCKRHHEGIKKPYLCTECDSCFQTLQFLEDHQNIHRNEKPYLCERCSSRHHSKVLLKTHLRVVHDVHEKKRIFTCKVCSTKFDSRKNLRSHQQSAHQQERKSINCPHCERVFSLKSKLKEHLTIVHKSPSDDTQRIFQCQLCDFKAIYQSKFDQHMLRHSENKNITCPVCQQKFKRQSALNAHAVVHYDARPFSCKVCSKSFKMKKTLTVHELLHSGVKNYKCTLCLKAYPTSTHLAMHMKSHKKIIPKMEQEEQQRPRSIDCRHIQINNIMSLSTSHHNVQTLEASNFALPIIANPTSILPSDSQREIYPSLSLF